MILASDLDRTLIYSQNAIDQYSPNSDSELYIAENNNGEPFSFMTKRASSVAEKLIKDDLLVPVTTRTLAQYDRVNLSENINVKWAIAANGAEVLYNGEVDKEWNNHIFNHLKDNCATLNDVERDVEEFQKSEWFLKKHHADYWFILMIIKTNLLDVESRNELNKIANRNNWQLSIQGRKLYLVPNSINKLTAIKYVSEKCNVKDFLAAGDSLLDKQMVGSAHCGFIPAHGELYNQCQEGVFDGENLRITENSGIEAGEEILLRAYEILAM